MFQKHWHNTWKVSHLNMKDPKKVAQWLPRPVMTQCEWFTMEVSVSNEMRLVAEFPPWSWLDFLTFLQLWPRLIFDLCDLLAPVVAKL